MNAPQLSVVICSLGRPGAEAAVASVLDSAGGAGIEAQVVIVWQSPESPPVLPPAAEVVRAFPAGLSYARNRGLATATADVVAFVDDDERVVPGWAGVVIAAFAEGADAAVGPIAPIDDNGYTHCRFEGGDPRWHTDLSTPPWTIGSGGNLAIRRALFSELGGFDQRLGAGSFGQAAEDTDVLTRLLLRGRRVRWRPDMIVLHPTKTAAERLASRRPYGFGIGRLVRRLRSPGLATRYGVAMLWAARSAIQERSPRRARELMATGAGFFAGALTRDCWTSPARLLARAPAEIRAEITSRGAEAWPVPYRGMPHFLWGVGSDLVLHAYAGVPSGWCAGVAARGAASAAGVHGIPAVRTWAVDDDVCWVLEQRLPGRHPREQAQWWNAAADWAASLARTGSVPLRATAWWTRVRTSATSSPAFEVALERLGDKPAVVVHGDLQPKNVLVNGDGQLGVLDWEQAVVDGPPGLDLLYLAIAARDPADRPAAVRALANDRDAANTAVLARLHAAGLDESEVRAALTVAVHVWAADEGARLRVLGVPPQPAVFAPLVAALDSYRQA